jgi:hypothetical protein
VSDEGCPVAIVLTGSAESDLYGNQEGGSEFDDTCPNGEVLVGLSGRYGGNIDRVRGHCGAVSLVEDTSTTPYTYSVAIGAGSNLPVHGYNVTDPYSIQCPSGTMAVGLSGSATDSVTALELHCAPLNVTGTNGSFGLSRGTVTTVSVTGGNPGDPFDWTAPGIFVLNRLFGRSGAWIDAIGVGATEPMLMMITSGDTG